MTRLADHWSPRTLERALADCRPRFEAQGLKHLTGWAWWWWFNDPRLHRPPEPWGSDSFMALQFTDARGLVLTRHDGKGFRRLEVGEPVPADGWVEFA